MNRRVYVIAGALFLLVGAIVLTRFLGTEFMPKQDFPIAVVDLTLPVGMVLSETDHLARQIEDILLSRQEVITCGSMVGITVDAKYAAAQGDTTSGVNKARIFARLCDKKDREKSSDTVINEVRGTFPQLEGVEFTFEDLAGSMYGTGSSPIEINIYGSDLDQLDRISTESVSKLLSIQGFKDIDKSLKKSKPELHVMIDREKASRMGLDVSRIASTVETAMLGKVVSRYQDAGDEYDIRVRFAEKFRETQDALKNIHIPSPLGFSLPLWQVADLEESLGPITINRKNQNRVVTITGSTFGRDLGSISRDISTTMKSISMPEGYFYDIGGTYEDMQSSFNELGKAFIVAILLIYMVMAAQFESFTQPLIIMFSLPLAYVGMILGLFITGKSLSVPSLMGLIILMGIVVNNGIVMIDYINHLRKAGMEKTSAIVQGASIRLRPILITSITTITAMLPMAFSQSEGAEMRSPMAVSIAFGLLFSMVLTLFVVPSAYSIFDSISQALRRKAPIIIVDRE